jgi:hypothetical protein
VAASASARAWLQAHLPPHRRLAHLERLAVALAGDFAYAQARSYKCSAGVKLAGELLAQEAGGAFAKAWKPKAAASVASKLYFRRGGAARGWLADALQGRVNCSRPAEVAEAAAFFQGILDRQAAAAEAAGLPALGESPTGAEVQAYSVAGLKDEGGAAIDQIGTYLSKMTKEGAELWAKGWIGWLQPASTVCSLMYLLLWHQAVLAVSRCTAL